MRTGPRTIDAARRLRRTMTPPEVLLWMRLRGTVPRWRRQHPLGAYVVDFYCPVARLVVEVDGMAHSMGDRPERDARRDAWIVDQGLRIERIAAAAVLADADAIADTITRMALSLAPPPPPLRGPPPPLRRGGEA